MLLGYDYLRDNNMVLDFKEKTLTFKNIKVKLNVPETDTSLQVNTLTSDAIANNTQENITSVPQEQDINNNDNNIQQKQTKNIYIRKNYSNNFSKCKFKKVVNLNCNDSIKEQE